MSLLTPPLPPLGRRWRNLKTQKNSAAANSYGGVQMDRKYTHRLAFANGKRFFVRNSKASQGDHRERVRSTRPSNLNKINVLGGSPALRLYWPVRAKHCIGEIPCYIPIKSPRQTSALTAHEQIMRKLPKIILVLIVLMAVLSPFMQLDSWDRFPVATGDIELQIISVLFETGMFFVIAGILKLFPALLRFALRPPTVTFSRLFRDVAPLGTDPASFAVPLRI
jgi:hypothetical protein